MAKDLNELTALQRLFEESDGERADILRDPASAYAGLRMANAVASSYDPTGVWDSRGYRTTRAGAAQVGSFGGLFSKRTAEQRILRHVARVSRMEQSFVALRQAEQRRFLTGLRSSVMRLGEFAY